MCFSLIFPIDVLWLCLFYVLLSIMEIYFIALVCTCDIYYTFVWERNHGGFLHVFPLKGFLWGVFSYQIQGSKDRRCHMLSQIVKTLLIYVQINIYGIRKMPSDLVYVTSDLWSVTWTLTLAELSVWLMAQLLCDSGTCGSTLWIEERFLSFCGLISVSAHVVMLFSSAKRQTLKPPSPTSFKYQVATARLN